MGAAEREKGADGGVSVECKKRLEIEGFTSKEMGVCLFFFFFSFSFSFSLHFPFASLSFRSFFFLDWRIISLSDNRGTPKKTLREEEEVFRGIGRLFCSSLSVGRGGIGGVLGGELVPVFVGDIMMTSGSESSCEIEDWSPTRVTGGEGGRESRDS